MTFEAYFPLIKKTKTNKQQKTPKHYGLKTDIGFLTIVSRSRAWTIVFAIFIIGGEVARSSALQVQIICRKVGRLCWDLGEREDNPSYHSSIQDRERENEQSSFITRAEFFLLMKSMWKSPQLRSKTIPLTSSDLSWPRMRSLHFHWGVYSMHTVTFIVNRPSFFFISRVLVVILDALQKVTGKVSAVTHRKPNFKLRTYNIGECKWNQNLHHTTENILRNNWASTIEHMKADSAWLLQTLCFLSEESCAR